MTRTSARVWFPAAVALACAAAACGRMGEQDTWTEAHHGRTVRVAVRASPVSVAAGETVDGDLVVVGGQATVDGTIRGDLVVVAGGLQVGPQAVIEHDLVAVGDDPSDVAPGAKIGHSRVEANFHVVRWAINTALFAWDQPALVLSLGLLGFVALLVLGWYRLIRRYDAARFHGTVEHHPVRAGLIGLLVHVAFGVLACAAFLGRWTLGLIGPLATGGFLLGCIGWVMGAVHVGRLIAVKRKWHAGAFTYGLAGLAIVGVASLIPVLGQLGALVISLVGAGALIAPAARADLPQDAVSPAGAPSAPPPGPPVATPPG